MAFDCPILESLRSLLRKGWTRSSKNSQFDLALLCNVAALRLWMAPARLSTDLVLNSPMHVDNPVVVFGAEALVLLIDLRKALAYVWDAQLLAQGPDMTKTLTALTSHEI